jgi:uncharacterized membrane protein YdbT with pleckstrin-like domain
MAMAPAKRAPLAGAVGPEEELWHGRPSARAMLGSLLLTLLVAIALPVAIYFLYAPVLRLFAGFDAAISRAIVRNRSLIEGAVVLLAVLLVGARVARTAWHLAVLKSHRYRVTNQRILVESGVFSKRIEEIDMRLIDDFQLVQSFFERVLGIGDITILSSDRTAAQLVLRGLPGPRELRELIRTSAYGATRGQLFTRET